MVSGKLGQSVCGLQEEGIVLKRLDSPWRYGHRGDEWVKLKPDYMSLLVSGEAEAWVRVPDHGCISFDFLQQWVLLMWFPLRTLGSTLVMSTPKAGPLSCLSPQGHGPPAIPFVK